MCASLLKPLSFPSLYDLYSKIHVPYSKKTSVVKKVWKKPAIEKLVEKAGEWGAPS